MVKSEVMERTFAGCDTMEARQTRRGCLQEILGCEARTEFKYYKNGNQFGHSLAEAPCILRFCCPNIYPFFVTIKEVNSDAEIMSAERPLRCGMGGCKCCCYQEMSFTSNNERFGRIEETCYVCVPRFMVYDGQGNAVYKIHQPTCVNGMCVQCCSEGNPIFGKGCCKEPFHVFGADQEDTDNGAPNLGKILKKPKSLTTEVFTDAESFDITFPKDATTEQKAMLLGSTLFINSNFFEGQDNNSGGAPGAGM